VFLCFELKHVLPSRNGCQFIFELVEAELLMKSRLRPMAHYTSGGVLETLYSCSSTLVWRMSNTDNFDLGIASLSFFLHLSTSQWMPAVGIASPNRPARSGVPYPALQEEVPELGGDGAGQEGPSGGGLCSLSLLVLWLNCDRKNRPFWSINSKKGWNSTHRYT